MPDHESARRQLEAAQDAMRRVSQIPEKDEFPVGTVLRWGNRVAIKTTDHQQPSAENWSMTMYARRLNWSYLVNHISGEIKDAGLRKASGWEDITVRTPPPVEVLYPEQSGYEGLVLRDPKRNLAWELRGAEWFRVFED